MKLTESLKPGDLEDLVQPVIEIDTFESKIDGETALVIAIFVDDEEPANDLSRFVEKSALDFIDTEVSTAPDEDGNYAIFIEVERNNKVPELVVQVIDSIKTLTDNDEWQFKTYKKEGKFDVTEENIKKKVRLKPAKKKSAADEEVLDFLEDSNLNNAVIKGDTIFLERLNTTVEYKLVNFAENALTDLKETAIDLNATSRQEANSIDWMLGTGWTCVKIGENIAIQKINESRILLLK